MVERTGKGAGAPLGDGACAPLEDGACAPGVDIDALALTGSEQRVAQKRRVHPGGWTKARRETFLGVLAQTCNVAQATRATGLCPSAPYELRRRDQAFATLFAEALALGYERLEAALINHALVGLNAIDVAALPAPERDALSAGGEIAAAMPGVAPTAEVTRAGIELALALLKHHRPSVQGDGKRRVPVALPTAAESDRQLLARLQMLATKRARQAKSLVVSASATPAALPAPDEAAA